MWSSLSGLRRPQLSSATTPLIELGLPGSITQQTLATRPQPDSPSHGLLFPTAHQESRINFTRALPARYVPPSGFDYPLDGLRPSSPCRFYLTPAALMGFHPSELPPRGRYSERFRPEAPTYHFARRYTRRRSAGPARRAAVPGVCPFRESLAAGHAFNAPTTGCSLGFHPSRVLADALAGISPSLLSRASQVR
jgi:hypothetical protein